MTAFNSPDDGLPTTRRPLTWCVQDRSLGPAEDLEYSVTLLRAVQSGRLPGPLVRVYRPEPTVAFGQRDVRLPGFEDARSVCTRQGFSPVVRQAGGRAAAYHHGSLVVDHLDAEVDAVIGSRDRFRSFAELYRHVLLDSGVDAAVGEVPGEYCPGEFSVHGRRPDAGPVKLIGTAQRAVSGAWLFSSSWVIQDPVPIHQVLVEVYAALGLDWDPNTAGSADQAPVSGAPAGRTTVEDVRERLRLRLRPHQTVDFEELTRLVPPASPGAGGTAQR
ncbi:lipoate--protein ligase family protein [Micrococcus terreus]|uniref:lipoyl protein ligase domain-containing protein n=1 Tax=Micrococcus terreus TaxID=574650 RepID=UPI0033D41BC6